MWSQNTFSWGTQARAHVLFACIQQINWGGLNPTWVTLAFGTCEWGMGPQDVSLRRPMGLASMRRTRQQQPENSKMTPITSPPGVHAPSLSYAIKHIAVKQFCRCNEVRNPVILREIIWVGLIWSGDLLKGIRPLDNKSKAWEGFVTGSVSLLVLKMAKNVGGPSRIDRDFCLTTARNWILS